LSFISDFEFVLYRKVATASATNCPAAGRRRRRRRWRGTATATISYGKTYVI